MITNNNENPWIMFTYNGKTVIDVSLGTQVESYHPLSTYHITPHYGMVSSKHIIQIRDPNAPEYQKG
jgi:hypothetical protein